MLLEASLIFLEHKDELVILIVLTTAKKGVICIARIMHHIRVPLC